MGRTGQKYCKTGGEIEMANNFFDIFETTIYNHEKELTPIVNEMIKKGAIYNEEKSRRYTNNKENCKMEKVNNIKNRVLDKNV